MGDDHDETLRPTRGQRFDTVHGQIQMLGVEGAEALIEEKGVEPPSPPTDHFRQTQRQGERGEKCLAAGQAVGPPGRVGGVEINHIELPVLGEPVPTRGETLEVFGTETGESGALLVEQETDESARRWFEVPVLGPLCW